MYLLENWAGINEWDVEIISSDIDTSILRRARARPLLGSFGAICAGALAEEVFQKRRRRIPALATICARQSSSLASISPSPPIPSVYRNFDVIFLP